MKVFLYILLFGAVFAISVLFILANSDQKVSLVLWKDFSTPELPIGLVVVLVFFAGFLAGFIFFPLTYVIKRLS